MSYLFQVSLGPVQSFIMSARRTRDLAFSSSFLSELARSAVAVLSQEGPSAEIIFPANPDSRDTPNKILAYISRSPEDMAEKIKRAIDNRVEECWKGVLQSIEDPGPSWNETARQVAIQQVVDLIEYTWAAVEFDKQQEDYNTARRLLEALMAARKNTRDFAPVRWGSDVPKSSFDGALESVIPENAYPFSWSRIDRASSNQRERLKKEYRQTVENLRRNFGAGPHEKLSGVDLLKRRGPLSFPHAGDGSPALDAGAGVQKRNIQSFPSTSHMAALPFLHALGIVDENTRNKAEVWKRDYLSALSKIPDSDGISFTPDVLPSYYRGQNYWRTIFSLDAYDGALLFPERFSDVIGDTQAFRAARKSIQEATKLLDDFLEEIHLHPTPYYALLVADGDSMGKVIEHLAKGDKAMEQHQCFSMALANFAGVAERVIKPSGSVGASTTDENETLPGADGVPIYTGGDDVLALLPLHTSIQCARLLASSFRKTLASFHDSEKKSPTLSVGLAVVHHLHPLGDALDIARKAEKRAKKFPGKNALAITVQKRGGPPCTVSGPWNIFDTRLEQHIELYQKDIIPSGMAYELKDLAVRLDVKHERAEQQLSPDYVRAAALRVFQRKLVESDKVRKALHLHLLKRMIFPTSELEKEYEEVRQMIERRAEKAESLEAQKAVDEQRKILAQCESLEPVSIGQLADELVVARLFAQVRNLARGKSEGVEER